MPGELTIVVSDVHMDLWEEDVPGIAPQRKANLLQFFDWVVQVRPERLVIVGDLLDVPERRGGALLPRHQKVLDRLREVVNSGVKFCYVVGNHDAGALGLSVAMTDPVIRVEYPLSWLVTGGRNILLEHGHLQDPWLWDYVRQLARDMWVTDPGAPTPWKMQPPLTRARTAPDQPGEPAAAEASRALPRLLQADRLDRFMDEQGIKRLEQAVEAELAEDYSEVGDVKGLWAPGVDPQQLLLQLKQAADDAARKPIIEQLVQWVYSRPHWRKAARERAREMAKKANKTVHGVIMGHTHHPDDPQGMDIEYVNCGSWRREDAHIVTISDGHLRLHRRKWNDPWPDLG